jgi:hypothetical protein
MKRRSLVVAASLVTVFALSGCGNEPTLPSVSGNEGALRFSYSGARRGTYVAAGDVHEGTGVWAYAELDGGRTVIRTLGRKGDNGTIELFLVFETPAAPGTIPIDFGACVQGAFCAGGAVQFAPQQIGGTSTGNIADTYGFRSGAIRITSMEGGRIRGTFSGRLTGTSEPLSVSDGQFDLPVVANTRAASSSGGAG